MKWWEWFWYGAAMVACGIVVWYGVGSHVRIHEDAEKWRDLQKGISTEPCEWRGTQDVQSSER